MDSRSRQRATRRRSPPESVATSASPGGRRSASMAISNVRSRSQAPAASILACRSACSASSASMSASGSPKAAQTSLKRSTSRLRLAHPLGHVAGHVLGRVELRLLGQVADGETRREPRLAGEPVVLARHDPQQRGLARAVDADDADLGPRIEGQVDALEDLAVGRVEARQVAHGVDELGSHGDQCARWPRGPGTRPRPGRGCRCGGWLPGRGPVDPAQAAVARPGRSRRTSAPSPRGPRRRARRVAELLARPACRRRPSGRSTSARPPAAPRGAVGAPCLRPPPTPRRRPATATAEP